MIEANELRIGNLVLAGKMREVGGGPYNQTVRQVCLISMDYDDEYMEYVETVEVAKSTNVTDDLCRNINPVPITEAWLDDFGFDDSESFDNREYEVYIYRKGPLTATCASFDSTLKWTMHGKEIDLQYIHQLQNLYFALTGDELQLQK